MATEFEYLGDNTFSPTNVMGESTRDSWLKDAASEYATVAANVHASSANTKPRTRITAPSD